MSVKTVITDGGFAMLRTAPGHKLVYTRAVCGSGLVSGTQLAALTDVTNYVMDLSIVDVKPTESAATLRLQLDNSKAPREFRLYQIGVFAKLLDGDTEVIGETLLQVMQYDEPDIVRAIPHISEYVVNTLMGQADKVEGVIDFAAYVSIRHFQEFAKETCEQFEAVSKSFENLSGRTIISDTEPTEPCEVWLMPMGTGSFIGNEVTPVQLSGVHVGDEPPADKNLLWVNPISEI